MSDKETAPWIKEAVAQIHSELDAATCDGHCETRKRALSKIIAAHCPVAVESRAPAPQPAELELEQEADGRWIAEFLRFTGVMAYGKSPEEAIRNAAKVLIESEQASPKNELCLGCGQECDIHKGTLVSVNGWYHESCAPKLFGSAASPTPEKCPTCRSTIKNVYYADSKDTSKRCDPIVGRSDSWHSSPGTTKGTK